MSETRTDASGAPGEPPPAAEAHANGARRTTPRSPHAQLLDGLPVATFLHRDRILYANPKAAAIRGDAAALLAKLRQTSPVNPSSMLAKMKASLAIDTRYEAIGWLDQSGDQWIVRSGGLPESGTLYVRYDGSGSGKTTVIGQLADGKISIDSDAGEALGVGRPVWIGLTH